jgi:hypothetical protein
MKQTFTRLKPLHVFALLMFLSMLPIGSVLLAEHLSRAKHQDALESFAKFSEPSLAIERGFTLPGVKSDDQVLAGEPTRQLSDTASFAHGYVSTAVALDKLRHQVILIYKNPKVISQWDRLIELSLIDVEERDWALFKFKNVPILGSIFSQAEQLDCVALLRSGKSCVR